MEFLPLGPHDHELWLVLSCPYHRNVCKLKESFYHDNNG